MNPLINFFLGTTVAIWLIFAAAASASTARYMIQRRKYGQLLPEDYVHIAALTTLVPFVAVGTSATFVDAFHVYIPFSQIADLVWQMQTAWWIFYCLSLYLSKGVFLALYRRLFGVSRTFAIFWWFSVAFITCTGLAALLSQFFLCGGKVSEYWNQKVCASKASLPEVYNQSVLVLACNVASDTLIILLPLGMLSKLQMSRSSRKWRLVPIFLVGVITIAIDILTWAFQIANSQSISWVSTFCLYVEPSIAVIVACLPTLVFAKNVGNSRPYQGIEAAENPATKVGTTSIPKNRWLASGRRRPHDTTTLVSSTGRSMSEV